MDGVYEAIHAKSKSEDPWRQSVKLFGREKRDEWLVVCFEFKWDAIDVRVELFASPYECGRLFLCL